MKSGVVVASGIELAFDQFGYDQDPALLLLMGNSAPGLVWPSALCTMLAEARFRVIRYDQRDTGLSTYVDFDTQPYSLHDLVADAFGLMDGLGIGAAHFVGMSQGGNTALLAGLSRPHRVLSVTTLMSSPDLGPKNDAFTGKPTHNSKLPRPVMDYVCAVIALNSGPVQTDDEIARRFVENFRLAAGSRSAFDDVFWHDLGRAVASRRHARMAAMANHSNHSKAQMATEPLTKDHLAVLTQPCLIIHGEGDPIFPPEHARWAASKIADADLNILPDMGHALDPAYFGPVTAHITHFLNRFADLVRDEDGPTERIAAG